MDEQRLTTILWRGRYIILATVAGAVAVAILATKISAKVYQAVEIIQVNSPAPATGTDPFMQQQANQALATTYATLIDDESFLSAIRSTVGGGRFSAADLQQRVTADPLKDTSLFQLKVEGASPREARRLAREIGEAFQRSVRKAAQQSANANRDAIQDQIAAITKQINALTPPQSSGDAEQLATLRAARTFLTQQLAGVVAGGIVRGTSVQVSGPPTASSTPVRPRPVLNIAAGVILGALVGLGLAYLRVRLDRNLRSADEAESLLEVPTLASIPLRRQFSQDDAVVGEAFDVLRANLAFLSVEQNRGTVVFTSYNPGEGKSSVVEGLAYAAVRGGIRVGVVDGDVRTQTLSRRLGYHESGGLTGVLAGITPLDDALVEVEPGLLLLPAGPAPPNPPSLLSRGRTREVVEDLREQCSLVIIDTPPVASLADASILASVSDGIVLVARVGTTERGDLPSAVANLRHSPVPVLGTVVLEPRDVDAAYYYASDSRRRNRRRSRETVRA